MGFRAIPPPPQSNFLPALQGTGAVLGGQAQRWGGGLAGRCAGRPCSLVRGVQAPLPRVLVCDGRAHRRWNWEGLFRGLGGPVGRGRCRADGVPSGGDGVADIGPRLGGGGLTQTGVQGRLPSPSPSAPPPSPGFCRGQK